MNQPIKSSFKSRWNSLLNSLAISLLNVTVYALLRTLHATYRYRIYGMEHRLAAGASSPGGAVALATWHGYSVAGTLAHAGQKVRPLCSQSRDGGMVAFVCQMMGMRPIRGSSSRGGKEARDEIIASIKEGYSVGITVDGPKGPAKIVKPGIVDVARKGSIAILPLTARADRNWVLRSWDRLNIPKPFSKVAVFYAAPIFIDPGVEGDAFEAARKRVETCLLAQEPICAEALQTWNQKPQKYQTLRSLQRV